MRAVWPVGGAWQEQPPRAMSADTYVGAAGDSLPAGWVLIYLLCYF